MNKKRKIIINNENDNDKDNNQNHPSIKKNTNIKDSSIYNEFLDRITFKKFKSLNIDSLRLDEIKNIATSLDLVKSGKKQDVYNRIYVFLENEKRISVERKRFKEQLQKEINPFNKDPPKLIIMNIQPLELLFWKVFRNKCLFKLIFSNFRYRDYIRYQDIIGGEIVVKCFRNGLEIIKDKIKQSQHIIRNNDEFLVVFGKLKDNTVKNKEILNTIFDNYISYNLRESFDNHYLWIKIIVNSLNTVALDIYRNKYNITTQEFNTILGSLEKSDSLFPKSNLYKSIPMFEYLSFYITKSRYKEYFNEFAANSILKLKQLVKFYNQIINNLKESHISLQTISIINELNNPLNSLEQYISRGCIIYVTDSNFFQITSKYIQVLKELGIKFTGHRWSQFNQLEMNGNNQIQHKMVVRDKTITTSTILKSISIINSIPHYSVISFLKCVLETNQINLIRFLFNQLTIGNVLARSSIGLILSCIEKTSVLDFYYGSYREIFFIDKSNYWIYLNRGYILKYYIELMKMSGFKFLIPKIQDYVMVDLNLLLVLIETPNSFVLQESEMVIESYRTNVEPEVRRFGISTIVSILFSLVFKRINLSHFFSYIFAIKNIYVSNNLNIINLLNYIFGRIELEDIIGYIVKMLNSGDNNSSNNNENNFYSYNNNFSNSNFYSIDIPIKVDSKKNLNQENTVIFSVQIKDLIVYFSLIGRSKDAISIMKSIPSSTYICFPLSDCGIPRYSNELLDLFIFYLIDNLEKSGNFFILFYCLKEAAKRDLLYTFKKMVMLYENILKKKSSKSNANVFTEKQLIEIINESSYYSNYELSHFLINHCSIDIKKLK